MKKQLLVLFFLVSLSALAQDAWTQLNDFPFEAFRSGSFVVNNEAYVIVREGAVPSNFPSSIYMYNVAEDIWEFVVDIPEELGLLIAPFVIEDRIFLIGENQNTSTIRLWEYNLDDTTFEERTPYPFGVEFPFSGFHATSFTIDGLGYVMSSPTSEEDINFASYDPTTDSWTERAYFPGPDAGGGSKAFVVNDKGYIVFGEELKMGPKNELWMYDPVLDVWEEKTPRQQGVLANPAVFVIQDQVFVGLGNVDIGVPNTLYSRYNPSEDLWDIIEAPSFVSKNPFSFTINGIGYVGVGDKGITDVEPTDGVWQLDPEFLSVPDVNATNMSIFPNPATHIVFIQSELPIYNATIYTSLGQSITTIKVENNQLDVSSLSTGIYFIELTSEIGTSIQKLLKK
ncbi:T9SS type A sorting domain-containing protein [uncultured Dokdonia sp.]|uniref:T9SS type A sorting domain-containing protein n=1 Tax=uncultured Dokdonia sp. TaxID=575653 RepID=UPI0026196654|nr:T9SS type A sorting domain-containing protein [uncultured Dokdonia sp.]